PQWWSSERAMPLYRFPGLKPDDRWCVTASNWLRAHEDGAAVYVVLASTHEPALEVVPLAALQGHAVDVPPIRHPLAVRSVWLITPPVIPGASRLRSVLRLGSNPGWIHPVGATRSSFRVCVIGE